MCVYAAYLMQGGNKAAVNATGHNDVVANSIRIHEHAYNHQCRPNSVDSSLMA